MNKIHAGFCHAGIRPLLGLCACALMLGMASGASAQLRGGWGSGEFDCQVMTESREHGLVMVQTDDPQKARQVAKSQSARTVSGGRSPAVSVVQCVKRGEKRFSDLEFRRFAESLPR